MPNPPNIQQGDCFRFDPRLAVDNHLWFVITNPNAFPDNVVVVNLTTYRIPKSDAACILEPGDHPYIDHQSCINYGEAWDTTLKHLQLAEKEGNLHRVDSVDAAVLKRIHDGAAKSTRIKIGVENTLKSQGIIES